MKRAVLFLAAAISILFTSTIAHGQLQLTAPGMPAEINFTGYTGAGFQSAPAAGQLSSGSFAATGWSDGDMAFDATRIAGDYARGSVSGAVTTGGFYAFTQSGNTIFGIQPGAGDWAPGTLTLRLQNNTGSPVTRLTIAYDIFIRNDQGRSSSLNFSHSTNNVSYTSASALDYSSPAVADAAGLVHAGARSATLVGLAVPNGAFYYLRWSSADAGGSGSRDEIGLDNISVTALVEPTTQASLITFSSITATSMTVSWTNGNGASRLVVARSGSAITGAPVDGAAYSASASFGTGDQISASEYAVFNGAGNSVTVTGLRASTSYSFEVFEYNGSGGTSDYLTIAADGNPRSQATSGVTDARLRAFAAKATGAGVLLEWSTNFEADNLGFNLYRDEGRGLARINPAIIAGSALASSAREAQELNRSYAWLDDSAYETSRYFLEDVSLAGKKTLHGPFFPVATQEKIRAERLAAPIGRTGEAATALSRTREAVRLEGELFTQWEIAGKRAVKLSIEEDGWYRVTQAELVGAGLDPDTDPRGLKLYTAGREAMVIVDGGDDGRFDPEDAIEFYGFGQETPFTKARTWWVVEGPQAGKRVKRAEAGSKPGGEQSFPATLELKERLIYFAALINGDRENFFGRAVSAEPVEHAFTLTHLYSLPPEKPTLEIALQGVTESADVTPDHRVKVMLNGRAVGGVVFDGPAHKTERISVPPSLLREGENLVALVSEAGETDVTLVDYLKIYYYHTYTADKDELRVRFNNAGARGQTITGFTQEAVRVVDVTAPLEPLELAGTRERDAQGYSVSVNPPGPGRRTLLAFTRDRIKRPAGIVPNLPSSWNASARAADMLIITHKEFIDSARRLKQARTRQGLKVEVIDVEDLYDEFGYGDKSAEAIKEFLRLARTHWEESPRFVLVLGDATFDPRDYLGAGDFDFVPTRLTGATYLETASDDWFVDFNDDALPDMYIGRLPVRTPGEAAKVIGKILAYEEADKEVTRESRALIVADKNDGFDFEAAAARIATQLPPRFRVEQVYRGGSDDLSARQRVLDGINRAPLIVDFMGHGSASVWRGSLLSSADAGELQNKLSAAFFINMTCLNGLFHDVGMDSMAEALLKADGGAVAVWGSSGLTLPESQSAMNEALIRELFRLNVGGDGVTIGEAVAKAKAATGDRDARRTWILFGDPSMRLRLR